MWSSRHEIVYCSVSIDRSIFTWKHCCHFNQWFWKLVWAKSYLGAIGRNFVWATAALAPWLPRLWCAPTTQPLYKYLYYYYYYYYLLLLVSSMSQQQIFYQCIKQYLCLCSITSRTYHFRDKTGSSRCPTCMSSRQHSRQACIFHLQMSIMERLTTQQN